MKQTTPIARESVACTCGKGVLTVEVTVNNEGQVAYSTETVNPCAACGSSDIVSARRSLPTPNE